MVARSPLKDVKKPRRDWTLKFVFIELPLDHYVEKKLTLQRLAPQQRSSYYSLSEAMYKIDNGWTYLSGP
jgi:hypothetical protein